MQRWRAILVALGAAWVANGLLFVVARQVGLLGSAVTARSNGAPLALAPVLFATAFGVVAAIGARLVLSWLVRSRGHARRVFFAGAGLLLVVSFVSPLQGLAGATTADVVVVEAMHVVAAIAAVIAAEWAARPRWAFGASPYVERAAEPRVALVTGATSGIGASVAAELARRGFRVLGVGRSAERARAIEAQHGGLRIFTGDLGSVRGAERLAAAIDDAAGPAGVGLVVHCAGTLKPSSVPTAEGIDENFAASFLGRFALTESVRLAAGARIVNVAAAESGALPSWMRMELARPEHVGNGMRAHGRAQLANDLWVASLARKGEQVFGYGPGAVDTAIRREIPAVLRWIMKPLFSFDTRTPDEAAQDVVRLLLDASLPASGFASRDGLFEHDAFVRDPQRQDALVALARELVAGARQVRDVA
jgi:NAD(P)-dependent dehydrogenase (short-subunit alcohol dehydrogenase family)